MAISVLGILVLIVGIGLRQAMPIPGAGVEVRTFGRPLMLLGVVLMLVGPLTAALVQVPAGNRGVVTYFGSVENRVLGEGLSLIIPVAEQVRLVDVRVQPHNFREIDASSQEYQTVKLTGTMNFHLDPPQVNDLYQKVGLDFADKVIDPAFNDFI
ncbi:MAG TPA: SPFH domain-containing protein, partial [Dehalococcoidia bacterium]|nr:SPFH domain-containing protein [Dehalococcoidia bacterium]